MQLGYNESRPDLGGNIRYSDANTFCPMLWRYLIERFVPRSMLDVGCGEGHAVAFFHRAGVLSHGIDGLQSNIDRAVHPIALHDILAGPYVMPVDLVWSCEVAEHILPEKVDNYIKTLVNGKIIAMTHALPGQSGHNHVNCQPDEYWTEKLQAYGYILERSQSVYRDISSRDHVANYFSASGLVFVKA